LVAFPLSPFFGVSYSLLVSCLFPSHPYFYSPLALPSFPMLLGPWPALTRHFPLFLILAFFLFPALPCLQSCLSSLVLTMSKHPFHIVGPSPWPFLCATSLLLFLPALILSWSFLSSSYLLLGGLPLLFSVVLWFRDIIIEGTFQGAHTLSVQFSLRIGFALLIASELIFFFAFFWAYLHSSLAPSVELGCLWPPLGVRALSPLHLPLLNTFVLLTSAATLTWSHYALKSSDSLTSSFSLLTTIELGSFFTIVQVYEYSHCSFTIADSVFGSAFFLATGFHGLHVLIGTLFLVVCLHRLCFSHFTADRHLGFEFAIWYWHFVDVVWLFLYIVIYCWGS